MKNRSCCLRLITLFGLVLAIACERDLTAPVPRQAEFVLLTPGTVPQVSAGRASFTCALEQDASVACWGRVAIAQTPDD